MSAEWLNGCVYQQNGPGDALRWPDACADEGSGLGCTAELEVGKSIPSPAQAGGVIGAVATVPCMHFK